MASWYLDKIEINGGFLSGLNLAFPKGLTCVIGPRGSGKSTLAETIRYALACPQNPSREVRELVEKIIVTASSRRD
jgi:chromosome segregation ATPase